MKIRKYKIVIICVAVVLLIGGFISLEAQWNKQVQRCMKPLPVVVNIAGDYYPDVAKTFRQDVERAILEWEIKTKRELFTVYASSSQIKNGENISYITLLSRDDKTLEDPTGGAIGLTRAHTDNDDIVKRFDMEIYGLGGTLVYQTTLHELGHARGLNGHSDNPNDVMSRQLSESMRFLTDNDVSLLVEYCEGKQAKIQ